MLENIKRIGIFMVMAQTVIHFAAGRQYEKYMKMIAGVIILLQFITPFVTFSEEIMERWKMEAQRITEQMEGQMNDWTDELPYTQKSSDQEALRRVEEEIKSRINSIIPEQNDRVADVEIILDEHGGISGGVESYLSFRCVKITLCRQAEEMDDAQERKADTNIRIEKIIVGQDDRTDAGQKENQVTDQDIRIREYRRIFAQALGVREEQVEVSYCGEW